MISIVCVGDEPYCGVYPSTTFVVPLGNWFHTQRILVIFDVVIKGETEDENKVVAYPPLK